MYDQLTPTPPMGQLFVISGPSGTGKTSLVQAVLGRLSGLSLSISTTTRPMRSKEKDGVDYNFATHEQFEQMIAKQAFIEYANVFNHYYGTSKAGVMAQLEKGLHTILEIDWQGAEKVRRQLDCTTIFILPPDKDSLYQRLTKRKQDSNEVIMARLAKAKEDIKHYEAFDYLVVNQDFETAVTHLCAIITARTLRCDAQRNHLSTLLNQLLMT